MVAYRNLLGLYQMSVFPDRATASAVALALERLPVAVAATTRSGHIAYANSYFCELVTVSADRVRGLSLL